MDLQYRWLTEIQPQDAVKLEHLLMASIADDGMLGFGESDSALIADYVAHLGAKLNNHIIHILLIDDVMSGRAAGVVVVTQIAHKTSCHIAELSKVIIEPTFRGAGLLKMGLRKVCQKATSMGVTRFIFDVREDTPSAKLWHALGFETYGRLTDYSHYQGKLHAGLFMTARIEELHAR
ncbi:GNAT family N-acetyltransferase [Reinekea forsetii]|uniref:N-acetyltransferase, GNAT family n=1 Tax=Reinekea forsetii TaxID=1336806 RepID=A0A2K8KMB7_9GAMM|nr:GNAT family N-acetyltransferase [Reinekea forsetii]ATX75975.1 N-acetyltransferase, GNAT family [Reinekea forsetii]